MKNIHTTFFLLRTFCSGLFVFKSQIIRVFKIKCARGYFWILSVDFLKILYKSYNCTLKPQLIFIPKRHVNWRKLLHSLVCSFSALSCNPPTLIFKREIWFMETSLESFIVHSYIIWKEDWLASLQSVLLRSDVAPLNLADNSFLSTSLL